MEEDTTIIASCDRSPELDAKDERNVSWRVPNSPKQHQELQEVGDIAIIDSPKERVITGSITSLKFDSNPASPSESRKAMRIAKTASENSSDEPKHNSSNKLWRHLFVGVTRSVDELYVHCEELEDKIKCQEVIDLLKRSRLDFKKLSDRIDEQSNFRQGQALSWDIRKPTLPSPNNPNGNPNAFVGHSNPSSNPDSPVPPEFFDSPANITILPPLDADKKVDSGAASELIPEQKKRLNPEAKPFSPSLFPSPPATAMVAVIDPIVALLLPPVVGKVGSADKASVSPRSSARHAKAGRGSDPVAAHRAAVPPGLVVQGTSRSLFGADKEGDDWEDERLQAEVLQASEQVWAAAEAWVEAEAAAEEQEWQMLALGIKSYLHQSGALSDYEDEPSEYNGLSLGLLGVHSSSISAHNSPKQQFVSGRLSIGGTAAADSNAALVGASADWAGNTVLLSPEQRAIWEEQPSPKAGLQRHNPGSAFQNRSRTGSRNNLLAQSTPKLSGTKKSPSTHIRIDTPPDFSPGDYSPALASHLSPAPDRSYRSPSQSPTDFSRTGGTPASGGRSLHDKLSSPERKKARSPSELQRKIEERQTHAEMLRDKSVAERVQKASIASMRVKQAEEREALRIIEKKQVLEDKQLAAQERLQRNLRQIQVRANNETSKVNEVLFNKDLNKEAIAQRLEEAETRILAASTRRQERLQNMTLDQKRRNARKAQQLSEWRLQFDKENMDRWDKLQQRLDSVHARRAARFIELQRRADENAVANEAAATLADSEKDGVVLGESATVETDSSILESPSKISHTHTSLEGTRLISALKKGVASAQKAARSVKSAIKKPISPTTAKKSPFTESSVDIDAEAATQLRSKAKGKREKRKLKAQLIELAQQADYAAIQEAMTLNDANENVTSTPTSVGVTKSSTTQLVQKTVSAAERYMQALHSFEWCPPESVQIGFSAARAVASKKVNLTAKADLNRLCSADFPSTEPFINSSDEGKERLLCREYTNSAAEAGLLAAMQEDIGVNGPHLLTVVVKDLLVASSQRLSCTTTASPTEIASSALNMHVMQRLFVLLETAPLGGSPSKPTKTESTVSEVMLLRLLFGPEVGVLREASEYQTLLDAIAVQYSHHNDGTKGIVTAVPVTQELEVKAEVWTLVFNLLSSCAGTPVGAGLIVQCGLAAVLVDVLHALLKSIESLPATATVCPTAIAFTAANILHALAKIIGLVARGPEDACSKGQCSQATLDAFVWYMFTSAQVPIVVDTLRTAVLRWQHTQSYHYASPSADTEHVDALPTYSDFIVGAAEFLSSVCDFVGRSGGLGRDSFSNSHEQVNLVNSVLQLSPTVHRHGKGRQLISILRRTEILSTLLSVLAALVSVDYTRPAGAADQLSAWRAALVDHLVVLSRVVAAVHSLVRADLSLAQGLTPEQQSQWITTASSLVSIFQFALDGSPQTTFPVEYTGRASLPHIEFKKTHVEHAFGRVLATLTLTCIHNAPLQRLCGATASKTALPSSLLAQLCSLSPKYFKDKRFKHCVLPCLITLSLDCDANVLQLERLGKLSTLLKYLDYSVKARDAYLQQQTRRRTELTSPLSEEAQHVQRLSHLIPADLWAIALVTLSQRAPPS